MSSRRSSTKNEDITETPAKLVDVSIVQSCSSTENEDITNS